MQIIPLVGYDKRKRFMTEEEVEKKGFLMTAWLKVWQRSKVFTKK